MNTRLIKYFVSFRLRLVLLIALGGAAHARAEETNQVAQPDFSQFKIITQRNIFDPNRTGAVKEQTRTRPRRTVTVEAFTLVGTMSYAKGQFAFFDGTRSDYHKVLEPSATIAGYTVKEISANDVKLESAGKQIELKVGKQMRLNDDGTWQMTDAGPLPTKTDEGDAGSTEGGSASGETATAASPPAASSGEENDVLKRLMQLREQESK